MIFGHLFAAAGSEVYRIDRHPTMAHHPATPMHEADLRLHLAEQTDLSIGLVDLRAFQAGKVAEAFRLQAAAGAVLLDGLDAAMLQQAGEMIWNLEKRPVFTIGSSGLTAGLIAHWRNAGILTAEPTFTAAGPADPILIISGSCSAVTAAQILWAKRQGYACVELDAAELASGNQQSLEAALEAALPSLRSGRDT